MAGAGAAEQVHAEYEEEQMEPVELTQVLPKPQNMADVPARHNLNDVKV